jgi:hypothetical protein
VRWSTNSSPVHLLELNYVDVGQVLKLDGASWGLVAFAGLDSAM